MEEGISSETSATIYQLRRRYVPENLKLRLSIQHHLLNVANPRAAKRLGTQLTRPLPQAEMTDCL